MNRSFDRKRRVLVAEDVEEVSALIIHLLRKHGFDVELAENGEQCLEKTRSFQPDLIILDIMMPKIHGMDVLKTIKADEETQDIGVIVCTARDFKSDQDQAKESGAFDVIAKPFQPEDFLHKVERFFSKTGLEEQKAVSSQQEPISDEIFLPSIETDRAYFCLWGTRGSIPVSGPRYVRHGGNTSCMEINCGGETVIFDAGTGIRDLGAALMTQKPRKLHIFVSHTHWDHIQGFPFFTPAYIPRVELVIYGSSGFGKNLRALFKGQLDRDYFPVQIEDMKASIEFRHLSESPVEIGDCKIFWEFTHHPGATVGFKIDVRGKKVGYITDHEFLKGYLGPPERISMDSEILDPYRKLLDFMSDIDILVGEAQYTNEEYQNRIGWGHSSLSNICLLCRLTNIKRWIITHHDPAHDDGFLQKKLNLTGQILQSLNHSIEISHAYDGMIEYL